MNKQKYHLTEDVSFNPTLWIIEKDAPNSGKVVFKTRDSKKAWKKLKKLNSHSPLYCFVMNLIDVRYWFCNCRYTAPYGLVISADTCKKHD